MHFQKRILMCRQCVNDDKKGFYCEVYQKSCKNELQLSWTIAMMILFSSRDALVDLYWFG